MYHSFFIHSLFDGHLGCFHALLIVNTAFSLLYLWLSGTSSFYLNIDVCFSTAGEKSCVWWWRLSLNPFLGKMGFPGASAGKESACNVGDLGSIPGSGKIPWRRERLPTPVFWPGDSHGQSMGSQSWTRLSDFHTHTLTHTGKDALTWFILKSKTESVSHSAVSDCFRPPGTVACKALLSMGICRQEYWRGLPFPSPGDLPDSGIEPRSPALQADSLAAELPGKPYVYKTKRSDSTSVLSREVQWTSPG